MDREGIEERIANLADELGKLLNEFFFADPTLADRPMKRANAIREEIESMGWMVNWNASFHLEDPSKSRVEVTISKPKSGLDSETAQKYDEWFLKRARIRI